VITLADITTVDGKKISADAWKGTPPQQLWHSYEWPRRPPLLSPPHWKQWQEALTRCFLVHGRNDYRLTEPLGRWEINPTQQWIWFYHPPTRLLYQHESSCWQEYGTSNQRGSPIWKRFTPTSIILAFLPDNCSLASIDQIQQHKVEISGLCPVPILTGQIDTAPTDNSESGPESDAPLSNQPTLIQRRNALPPEDKWAVELLVTHDNGRAMAHGIKAGSSVAVSDGSFHEGSPIGTSGFVLCPTIHHIQTDTVLIGQTRSQEL
jgi:hypothetical protein